MKKVIIQSKQFQVYLKFENVKFYQSENSKSRYLTKSFNRDISPIKTDEIKLTATPRSWLIKLGSKFSIASIKIKEKVIMPIILSRKYMPEIGYCYRRNDLYFFVFSENTLEIFIALNKSNAWKVYQSLYFRGLLQEEMNLLRMNAKDYQKGGQNE